MRRLVFILSLLGAAVSFAEPANPFFAMNTIARGGPEVAVPLLKELGYDGLGGAAGDDVMAQALEAQGLRFFNGYITLGFDDQQTALDDRLNGIISRMKGHHAALWLALQKVQRDGKPVPKSSPDGDDIAVKRLREIASFASEHGVTVALYPHTGLWLERVEDAARVAGKVDRPDVGVTFNLCHWLKVEGSGRDPLPVLQAVLPRLMFVTISGADTGDTKAMGWDRLIQPLGSGSYDVAAFMKKVREAGYRGPVGYQGYGIKQDPREVLNRTMAAWHRMTESR